MNYAFRLFKFKYSKIIYRLYNMMNVLEDITIFVMVKYSGTCLSKEYDASKLTFKCKRGHEFVRTADEVLNDGWCDVCTIEMDRLDNVRLLAAKNNCVCLDGEYVLSRTNMDWCCKKGHIWTRSLDTARACVNWCFECAQDKKKKDLMDKVVMILESATLEAVDKKQLEDLSLTKYIDVKCNKNHITSVQITLLCNYGSDYECLRCRKRGPVSILDAQEAAKQRGGKCLSTKCDGIRDSVEFECHYKHKWTTVFGNVLYDNTWCPDCKISPGEEISRNIFQTLFSKAFPKDRYSWLNGLELDGYSDELKLAFEYNGPQHYEFNKLYHKTNKDFEEQLARDKKKNVLCVKCGVILVTIPYTIKYMDLQGFIMDKCLENNVNIPYPAKIDITTFSNIYTAKDKWLAKFKALVKEKGGKLVDDNPVYIDSDHKIQVECKRGHSWGISWNKLRDGSWCSTCYREHKNEYKYVRHTIEEMKELAIRNNGKCLSNTYVNTRTILSWYCNGCKRKWDTFPYNILNGYWCGNPKCKDALSKNKKE